LWGHILHEVVESCLSENRWDQKYIDDEIEEVIQGSLLDLLRIEKTIEEATEEVKNRASGLKEFSKRYIGKTPKVG
jgi:DNA replication ATP-dependent helicase Dna2